MLPAAVARRVCFRAAATASPLARVALYRRNFHRSAVAAGWGSLLGAAANVANAAKQAAETAQAHAAAVAEKLPPVPSIAAVPGASAAAAAAAAAAKDAAAAGAALRDRATTTVLDVADAAQAQLALSVSELVDAFDHPPSDEMRARMAADGFELDLLNKRLWRRTDSPSLTALHIRAEERAKAAALVTKPTTAFCYRAPFRIADVGECFAQVSLDGREPGAPLAITLRFECLDRPALAFERQVAAGHWRLGVPGLSVPVPGFALGLFVVTTLAADPSCMVGLDVKVGLQFQAAVLGREVALPSQPYSLLSTSAMLEDITEGVSTVAWQTPPLPSHPPDAPKYWPL